MALSSFVLFAGLILSIDFNFDKGPIKRRHMHLGQYITGSCFTVLGSIMCENILITILMKVSAPTDSIGILNAGLTSGMGATLGRALGNVAFAIAVLFSGDEHAALYMYSFFSTFSAVLIIVSLSLYKKMEIVVDAHAIIDEEVKTNLKRDQSYLIPALFEPFKSPQKMVIGETNVGGIAAPKRFILNPTDIRQP